MSAKYNREVDLAIEALLGHLSSNEAMSKLTTKEQDSIIVSVAVALTEVREETIHNCVLQLGDRYGAAAKKDLLMLLTKK